MTDRLRSHDVKKSWLEATGEVFGRALDMGALEGTIALGHFAAYGITHDPNMLHWGIAWAALGAGWAANHFALKPLLRSWKNKTPKGPKNNGPV